MTLSTTGWIAAAGSELGPRSLSAASSIAVLIAKPETRRADNAMAALSPVRCVLGGLALRQGEQDAAAASAPNGGSHASVLTTLALLMLHPKMHTPCITHLFSVRQRGGARAC